MHVLENPVALISKPLPPLKAKKYFMKTTGVSLRTNAGMQRVKEINRLRDFVIKDLVSLMT